MGTKFIILLLMFMILDVHYSVIMNSNTNLLHETERMLSETFQDERPR